MDNKTSTEIYNYLPNFGRLTCLKHGLMWDFSEYDFTAFISSISEKNSESFIKFKRVTLNNKQLMIARKETNTTFLIR